MVGLAGSELALEAAVLVCQQLVARLALLVVVMLALVQEGLAVEQLRQPGLDSSLLSLGDLAVELTLSIRRLL